MSQRAPYRLPPGVFLTPAEVAQVIGTYCEYCKKPTWPLQAPCIHCGALVDNEEVRHLAERNETRAAAHVYAKRAGQP